MGKGCFIFPVRKLRMGSGTAPAGQIHKDITLFIIIWKVLSKIGQTYPTKKAFLLILCYLSREVFEMREENCMGLLKQINDALEKYSNNTVKDKDLTFTQINVLNLIAESERGEMTMKEIEKELHVAQPTVVGIVKRLGQKGLVNTFGDEANKKVRHVALTDEGEKLCGYAEKQLEKVEDRLLKGLKKKDRKEFVKMLRAIRESLD